MRSRVSAVSSPAVADPLAGLAGLPCRTRSRPGAADAWPPVASESDPLPTRRDRFCVRLRNRLVLISPREVEYFEAAGSYVRIHLSGGSWLRRGSLEQTRAEVGDDEFFRLHRRYLVRLTLITQVLLERDGDYRVVLRGGRQLPVGRGYRQALLDALSGAPPLTGEQTRSSDP